MSHGRKTKCRKACCWVPFDGVCGKRGNCSCHTGFPEQAEDTAAVIILEQARIEAARRLALPAWQRQPARKDHHA